jgi:hypothetical protein
MTSTRMTRRRVASDTGSLDIIAVVSRIMGGQGGWLALGVVDLQSCQQIEQAIKDEQETRWMINATVAGSVGPFQTSDDVSIGPAEAGNA